jgi:hypothetical protein
VVALLFYLFSGGNPDVAPFVPQREVCSAIHRAFAELNRDGPRLRRPLVTGRIEIAGRSTNPASMTWNELKKPGRRPGFEVFVRRFRLPLLSAIPVVDVFAGLVLRNAITLLNFAFQLIAAAVDDIKIIVRRVRPHVQNGIDLVAE